MERAPRRQKIASSHNSSANRIYTNPSWKSRSHFAFVGFIVDRQLFTVPPVWDVCVQKLLRERGPLAIRPSWSVS